jgi:hypothetical protein
LAIAAVTITHKKRIGGTFVANPTIDSAEKVFFQKSEKIFRTQMVYIERSELG